MAYHSKYNNSQLEKVACGICIAPLKTSVPGPAKNIIGADEDIIDEALKFFRPNIFFKNFDIQGKFRKFFSKMCKFRTWGCNIDLFDCFY